MRILRRILDPIDAGHGRALTNWYKSLGRRDIAGIVMAVAMAFMARLALGYRSFPDIDDFVYIPLARAQFDPSLYPTDLMVQEFVFHTPVLAILVWLLDSTIGVAVGLLIATLALSVATVLGLHRLMRGIGADGLLLPLVVLITACGALNGLGRGQYGGIFGDAFHMQWMALCLLLWTYERFVARQAVAAGVLLGLTAMMHPIVGAHGAAVLFIASFPSPDGRWRRLAVTAAVSMLVSSPAMVPLILGLVGDRAAVDFDVVGLGYLFRTPHEFVLQPLSVALFVVVVGLGWSGMILLAGSRREPGLRCFGGLLLGQTVLAGLAIAAHTTWSDGSWIEQVSLVYRIVLTRTTPLLMALSAVAFAVAVERHLGQDRPEIRSRAARCTFWGLAGIALLLVMLQIAWHPVLVVTVVLLVATVLCWRKPRLRAGSIAIWAIAGLVSMGLHLSDLQVEAPLEAEEDQLYAWARQDTPRDALFVVPPGFQAFRLHADRGAYVDFKTFPATTAPLIREWRRRLEEVAAPDRLALEARGWPGVVEWDRTYANRNTPQRIADLLSRTGSDYFIWDRKGLEAPPFTQIDRDHDPRLIVAFTNTRFTVYRLAGGGDGRSG